MATLRPFRALRPNADNASRIAAVPYDVVSTDEARALAGENPMSFLRVSRAELELCAGSRSLRARRLRARRKEFRDAAKDCARRRRRAQRLLLPAADGRPCPDRPCGLLLDRRVRPRHHQEARAHAPRQGRRPHAPHAGPRRADRPGVPHLPRGGRCGSRGGACDGGGRRSSTSPRSTACSTRSGGSAAPTATRSSRAFGRIPALYIADGHHRAASAARARNELRERGLPGTPLGDGADASTMLAVAFPHNQVQILPYNRTVKDLGGLTPEQFMEAVRERFEVEAGPRDAGAARRHRHVLRARVAHAAPAHPD